MQVKQLEEVSEAFVATGDEFLLSLCLDNFSRIEKQAYFTRDLDMNSNGNDVNLRLATVSDIDIIEKYSDDLNGGWSDKMFLIFTKKWAETIDAFPACYSLASKKKCIMDHGSKSELFSLNNLVRYSLKGQYNRRILKKYRWYMVRTIRYNYIVLYLVALLPKVSESLGRKIKRLVCR